MTPAPTGALSADSRDGLDARETAGFGGGDPRASGSPGSDLPGALSRREVIEKAAAGKRGAMDGPKGRVAGRWDLVEGLRMHALASLDPVAANSPTVVLVHGLVVSSRYMAPTAARLAPYCRVYAPDLPGFGKSAKPPHVLNLPQLADALAAWMQALGIGTATLLGNSFGCQIVAEFALRHPERIDRAVLVGPTVDPAGRPLLRQVVRWMINGTREPLSLMSILALDYLDAGLRRAVYTLQYMMRDRIEEKLPRLEVPTLVVRGARDPIVPQRWAEVATRLLTRGRLVVIPGAAHTVNYDAPLELVRVVRPFLGENRQGERWQVVA